jgi:hypothetical protein
MKNLHGWVSYALKIVAVLIALALVKTDDPITAAELVDKLMQHWLMEEAVKAIARIVIALINKRW